MNPRFFDCARTAIALVFVFSMTTAPSRSTVSSSAATCLPPETHTPADAEAHGLPLCPPSTSGTYDGPPPGGVTTTEGEPDGYGHDRNHSHGPGLGPLIAALAGTVVVGTAIAADHGKVDFKTPQELDADGPKFPSRPILGGFQIHGYAAAGWPFAVDIETQPRTYTWLELRYEHRREPVIIDLSRPEGGRRVQLVRLPGDDGSVQVARYSLHSALLPHGQRASDVPMTVYGIGAGPNAVGMLSQPTSDLQRSRAKFMSAAAADRPTFWRALASQQPRSLFNLAAAQDAGAALYLTVTAFGPTPASSPNTVKWAVAARRQFPLSRIEVLRYPDANDKKGKFKAVARAQIDLLLQSQASGLWGALQQAGSVGAGRYALQARAWRTRSEGGDWTGAYSANYVSIQ
jgi:hypothetical protein